MSRKQMSKMKESISIRDVNLETFDLPVIQLFSTPYGHAVAITCPGTCSVILLRLSVVVCCPDLFPVRLLIIWVLISDPCKQQVL